MKKNIIRNFFAVLTICSLGIFSACSSFLDSSSGVENSKYGSITINNGDGESRSLDISSLTSATVTVSGYKMSDITKSNVAISSGKGSVTVEGIPVGKNRVVTVKSNIDGAVIRSVVDVNSGENTVSVNWDTTVLGNIFYNLIKSNKDVSSISTSAFDSAIPDVHASLVNASLIASDYIAGSLKNSSSYVLDYGTVSVTASKLSGYTLQITDIASEKVTLSDSETTASLKAYPGTWKAWLLDSAGTKVAEKAITVVSGEISTVEAGSAKSEVHVTGKIIVHVPSSLNFTHIWAWSTGSESTNYTGGTWPGKTMTLNGSYYDYELDSITTAKVIFNVGSNSSQTANLYVTEGEWNYIGGSSGTADSDGTKISSNFEEVVGSGEETPYLTVVSAEEPLEPVKIYVSATSAPTIWVHDAKPYAISEKMGESWPGNTMTSATDLKDNTNWYVKEIPAEHITGSEIYIQVNSAGRATHTGKTATFWYDAAGVVGTEGTFYDEDPTTVPEPVAPTVKITPANGSVVGTSGAISVTFGYGNDEENFIASVTISGTSYNRGTDFTGSSFSKSLKELGITTSATVTVSATATNSVGNATAESTFTVDPSKKEDPFTWDNANVYFVIQDRFYDGDSSNNNSYGRMSTDELGKTIGTFHGGDIKGLTQKLDYINDLGVNAIWITAPYEQAHGWCGGGSSGDFAHYAYHGYYPLDYTMIDKNMGTVEEFRTFVTECHKRGIRVVMDVVMNHTGYLTLQDCQDYSIDIFSSSYSGGKSTDMGFKIGSDGDTYHKHHDKIDYNGHNDGWAKWWGTSWIRAGVPGYTSGGSDDLTKNLDNLPDVKTESTTAQTVAPILQTKWAAETSGYSDWIIPAASSLRNTSSSYAPAVWIEKWLAVWVEEFGIDGFRCDTAKHVDMYRWGELKELCKTALAAWRASSRADEYAKDWDEDFWMTGECFGWKLGSGGAWFTTGGFDSMIDFTANGGSFSSLPSWESRANSLNGSTEDGNNALLYISSHDTSLGRSSNQIELGTLFVLMPGQIQIYYGDETVREFGETGSDFTQGTRSDMNWDATTGDCAKHWSKLGTFRKYNPAVGAGQISGSTRTYSGAAGESKVAISLTSTTVDVSGLFADGTTVYNWYDGKSATVSGGSVTFSGSGASTSAPVLVSDKNPADYGVSF